MLLLADWASAAGLAAPVVLTVDHGLRPGSGADAKTVVSAAKKAGLTAHVLRWRGPKPKSDIEAAARVARYRLMGEWCRRHDIGTLYVAHSREDMAETFLIRLGRGSGVDGLAAMSALAPFPLPGFEALSVARPLLGVARSRLRSFLMDRGLSWREDPMNEDPRFARARLRAAWPVFEEAGLTVRRIADAAGHLARARLALDWATEEFLAAHAQFEGGIGLVDAAALAAIPREIGLRALAAALGRVSGATYRPRFERLERLMDAIAADGLGKGRTLLGCQIRPAPRRHARYGRSTLLVTREPGRARAEDCEGL